MFRIAVCDNDKEDLEKLYDYAVEYCQTHLALEGDVAAYTDARMLISDIQNGVEFDAYILDIIMPRLNGIELGRQIKDLDYYASIIYTTSSKEYAFEAFGIHALDYLEKPIHKEKVFEALDMATERYRRRIKEQVRINVKGGMCVVNVEDIIYVENVARVAEYCLQDGNKVTSVSNRSTFENSIEPIPSLSCFVQPHKSFFVNMNHVRVLKPEKIILDNEKEIPVSRVKAQGVKKSYLKFLSERGGVL